MTHVPGGLSERSQIYCAETRISRTFSAYVFTNGRSARRGWMGLLKNHRRLSRAIVGLVVVRARFENWGRGRPLIEADTCRRRSIGRGVRVHASAGHRHEVSRKKRFDLNYNRPRTTGRNALPYAAIISRGHGKRNRDGFN